MGFWRVLKKSSKALPSFSRTPKQRKIQSFSFPSKPPPPPPLSLSPRHTPRTKELKKTRNGQFSYIFFTPKLKIIPNRITGPWFKRNFKNHMSKCSALSFYHTEVAFTNTGVWSLQLLSHITYTFYLHSLDLHYM